MTTSVPPGIDSVKAPLVLLALGGTSDENINTIPTDFDSVLTYNRAAIQSAQTSINEVHLNARDYIEEFVFEQPEHGTLKAIFKCFDPDFDALLEKITYARAKSSNSQLAVHFRFGWVLDGGSPYQDRMYMSPAYRGNVLNIEQEFTNDGCRLTFEVGTTAAMAVLLEKHPNGRGWNAGTPGHVVIAQALRTPAETPTDLSKSTKIPEVFTPVPCVPISNNGQPIVMTDAPLTFCRELITRGLIRAEDEALRYSPMNLMESTENGETVYVLAPEGYHVQGKLGIARTYHVGRGRGSTVVSFRPTDNKLLANIMGGSGITRGVTDERDSGGGIVVNTEKRGTVTNTGAPSDKLTHGTMFSRIVFDREVETQRQKRDHYWSDARRGSNMAEAEVVGDPQIALMDPVEVFVYRGGTTTTAGGYMDSLSQKDPAYAQVMPSVSGRYTVLGFSHKIGAGGFTTALTLCRSSAPTAQGKIVAKSESAAVGDAVPALGDSKKTEQAVDRPMPRRYGRNVID